MRIKHGTYAEFMRDLQVAHNTIAALIIALDEGGGHHMGEELDPADVALCAWRALGAVITAMDEATLSRTK